jgi:acetyltransferase-like isoleucine patch superfamily enzyme
MRLVFLLFKGFFISILRHFYWFINLSKAQKGKGLKILFPVKIEGKGKLVFGKNCSIAKNAYFACGQGSVIKFGNKCRIDEGVEIYAGKDSKISFGDNCWIMKNTIIRTKKEFVFGNDVNIATHCAIFSREGNYEGLLKVGYGTHIGDNTIMDVSENMEIRDEIAIGPNCVIYTHDHDYQQLDKPAWKGGVVQKPVIIKNGAWIGSGVTILPGVEIAERTVVAAGAVVTKNTEISSIYGGVPAKKIK